MRRNNHRLRENRHKSIDPPENRYEPRQNNHHSSRERAERQRPLEVLQNLRDLDEEIRVFGFLARGAPHHLDGEHVGDDGLADVQRDAAEEDGEEGDPADVFPEGGEEAIFAGAVAQDGEGDVAADVEDGDDGEVDLEAVEVVVIEGTVEPAHEEIVHEGEEPGRAQRVVGADVGEDGELGGEGYAGEEEAAEEFGEGAVATEDRHRSLNIRSRDR